MKKLLLHAQHESSSHKQFHNFTKKKIIIIKRRCLQKKNNNFIFPNRLLRHKQIISFSIHTTSIQSLALFLPMLFHLAFQSQLLWDIDIHRHNKKFQLHFYFCLLVADMFFFSFHFFPTSFSVDYICLTIDCCLKHKSHPITSALFPYPA